MDKFERLQVAVLKIHNKNFPVYEGVNTVGRNKEAIVNIKHLNISQNHAVVVVINGDHFISDLNSSNGIYLDNCKIEPFKLFELKNNISLKLGDLCGTYISQGPFSDNDQSHFEMTQDVTQSFYGSNTQILDNSKTNNTGNEIEDIHEAPTQEISWASFKIPKSVKKSVEKGDKQDAMKKSTKILPPNTKTEEEDIHSCETQVICDPSKDHTNKIQALRDKKTENVGSEEDIHEAPTQEISWATFKIPKSVEKSVEKGDNQDSMQRSNKILSQSAETEEEDIYNCETQVIGDPSVFKEDHANKIQALRDKKTENVVTEQETVPKSDMNKDVFQPHSSASIDEDIHNAPTQVVPLLSNNIDDINNPIIPESELFVPFNDEELPLLGNNDNYVEIHQVPVVEKALDIHEADTQAMDVSNKMSSQITDSNLEDDEATDCEDNAGNIKDNSGCSPEKQQQNVFQDEATDCEDSSQNNPVGSLSGRKNKNYFLESDDDSNDSMEFFKVERSFNKDAKEDITKSDTRDLSGNNVPLEASRDSENCSDKSIEIIKRKKVRRLSSDSDTDEEIGFGRKKKSSMVISTEDICEKVIGTKSSKSDDFLKKDRDSYLINDTDSETEIGSEGKVYLEESIAPTQNQSTADLNDTDCIPATQQVTNQMPIKSVTKSPLNISDNVNGSSEESFKLGLTELMINPSQTTGNNGTGSQEPCCSKSLKDHTPLSGDTDLKNNVIIDEIQSDDTDKTDIYIVATQAIKESEIPGDNDDKNLQHDQGESDIYLAPTQKIGNLEKPVAEEEKLLINFNETEYLYDMPTQKMNVKVIKDHEDRKSQLDETNTDIYFAATQKVSNEITDTVQNRSVEESMDDLYLQPTQQLEDTFNQPTQRVNKLNFEMEGDSNNEQDCTKPTKKKFSFKKTVSNMDCSLTSLLKHSPKQTLRPSFFQTDDRSSIELEFVGSVNAPAETSKRPSNPLSHVLENLGRLDDTVKPKENKSETVISETPVVEKMASDDPDNQEEVTEKINDVTEESERMKDKNEVKSISGDNSVTKEEKISVTSAISRKGHVTADSDLPTRSFRTGRSTTLSGNSKRLQSKINSDLSDLNVNNEKHESSKAKLDIKTKQPRARRTTRRLSSPKMNSETLDVDDKKAVNADLLTDNSLNATTSEVNQSVALLESKLTKTRKTMKSSEILKVKVPKSRKSMSITEIDETTKPLDVKLENPTNQEKIVANISSVHSMTKKRGRPKTKQADEREIKGKKAVNKSLRGGTLIINNNPETIKEEANANQEAIKSTSTRKVVVSSYGNTRQVGKQKRLAEVKSDNSDSSIQSVDSNQVTPKKQKLQPNRQAGKRKYPTEVKSDNSASSNQSGSDNLATPKIQKQQSSRQVGKRKQPTEGKSDNSDTSIHSVDSSLTTPKKQKLLLNEALLNTKERELRKQKPKVVFTMLESPQMESMIKRLGGSVIESVDSCSVLVTEHIKRSQKLLSAVGLGKPICSPQWITDSKKAHEFLDPWDYVLTDPEAEKKWNFSLKESLNRSRTEKLLDSYVFQIQVTTAADVLKGAIESCGGKCISKIPSQPLENTFIISVQENQGKYRKIMKQHPNVKVIEPEAIFDGVLRQELRFSKHYLT